MPPDTSPRWSLVLPVKVLALAKSRLTGLAGPRRAELALAMAADTVAASVACPAVETVIVVTDDAAAAADLSGLGAVVVPDGPGDGLNAALTFGAGLERLVTSPPRYGQTWNMQFDASVGAMPAAYVAPVAATAGPEVP